MMRQKERSATGTFSPEEVYKNDWVNLLCERASTIVSKAEIAMYKSRQVTFKHGQDVFEDFEVSRQQKLS